MTNGNPPPAPILEAREVTKSYGHITALDCASFAVNAGEIVALIGDNGAGKSTMVKVLTGVIAPDSGEVLVDGEPVSLDPAVALEMGISTVFQDLALAKDLDSAANLFLGRELYRGPRVLGFLDKKKMRSETERIFDDLGIRIRSIETPVAAYSGGQQQSVAVARAAAWATRLVILDEPTAALGVAQTKMVHDLIKRLRDERGMAVVLISHSMPDVLELSDRVEVLRLGRRVGRLNTAEATSEHLISAMTGGTAEEA